jgi:hypothetical protein
MGVGAKCRSASTAVMRRYSSSGKGWYLLRVRNPASTWATGTRW